MPAQPVTEMDGSLRLLTARSTRRTGGPHALT
jgi:hypothetical protein